jgi:hypothetical protein
MDFVDQVGKIVLRNWLLPVFAVINGARRPMSLLAYMA